MNHRIGLLFFLSVGVLPAFAVRATEGEKNVEELGTLVVSSPLHETSAETVYPVTVLSGDELRLKAGSTIGETLRQEVGISSASFGPGVGQPVIRGQSGPRVRVLQSGLGSLDVSSLSPDHANSTEAILAQRIEVLRGPATLLYSSGAIGGIVNVIDNRIPDSVPEKGFQGALEQRFDSVSDQKTSVFTLDAGKGPIAVHLDGFFRERDNVDIPGQAIDEAAEAESHGGEHEESEFNTDGFIENSDARAKSGSAGFSIVGERGFVGMSVNYLENDYGIPPGAHGHHEEEEPKAGTEEAPETVRVDLKQVRYDLKGEISEPLPFADALKIRLAYNDYEHTELENGVAGTKFENEGVEGRLELVHKPWGPFDHGVVGFQSQASDFSAIGEEAFVPESEINSYGVFALEDIHAGAWVFELGLRVENQTIDPKGLKSRSHTPVSGSASALWNLTESDALSLAFTRSQRAPEVQELYANGPHLATRSYELGDAGLTEETAHNIELGYRFDRPWLRGAVNLFYSQVDDYIFQANTGRLFDPDADAFVSACSGEEACLPVFQSTQLGAVFKGFEAEVTVPLLESLYGDVDLTLFGDYVRGKLENGGGDVPRLPPLRYGAQLDFTKGDWHGDIRLTRGEKQDHPGDNETETDGYLQLDLGMDYRLAMGGDTDLMFFVKGRNLLDEEIRNSTSYLRNFAPEPGRGVELGIRASF